MDSQETSNKRAIFASLAGNERIDHKDLGDKP